MSTTQNVVTVVRVEGAETWLRVECVGDHFGYPFSDVYAFALLCEAFQGRTYGKPVGENDRDAEYVEVDGPLLPAIKKAFNEVRADQNPPPKNGDSDRAWYDALDNLMSGEPHFKGAAAFAARFVQARGYRDFVGIAMPPKLKPGADGLVRPAAWWDNDEERKRVGQALQQEYQRARSERPDMSIGAVLVVEATEPAWLAHLRVGMNWDSNAYDSHSAWIPFHELGKGSDQLW